jgi:acid phosphatase (class A)
MIRRLFLLVAPPVCAIFTGCAQLSPAAQSPAPLTDVAAIGYLWPGYVRGYMPERSWPDMLALLPAPPAPGSAAELADAAAFRTLKRLRTGPAGSLAQRDATLEFPAAASTFSCALGVPVSSARTPQLNMLLRRALADTAGPTYPTKERYQRQRPFATLHEASCTPGEEASLSKDGSYPSAHAAIGWGWALVLAEMVPERSDTLLQRGRAFAEGRAICGVHWQSDVDAGMRVAAIAVARLHAEPAFRAQRDAARKEWGTERAAGAKPEGNCAAEEAGVRATLGMQTP